MAPLVVGLSLGVVPLLPLDGGEPNSRLPFEEPTLVQGAALDAEPSADALAARVVVEATAEKGSDQGADKSANADRGGNGDKGADKGADRGANADKGVLANKGATAVSAAASAPVPALVAAERVAPGAADARKGAALSREQHQLVDFISRTYQVASAQAVAIVVNTYRVAREAKLDPHLVLAVMSIESKFDASANSTRGAQGLMQVLTRVHASRFEPFGGIAAAFDPIANIRVGTQILKEYIRSGGSAEAGLRGYVGVGAGGNDRGYGSRVLAERARFAAVAAGRDPARAALVPATSAPGGTPARADAPLRSGIASNPATAGELAAPPEEPSAPAPRQQSALEAPSHADRPRAGG